MLAKWLLNWLILSVSVFVVTRILPSVRIKGFATAVIVAFVYGILKTIANANPGFPFATLDILDIRSILFCD